MDATSNPYSPGAGLRPLALTGRDDEIATWDAGMRRVAAGRPARPLVLQGLRGVGKTVLLGEYLRMAEARDWMTALVEAGSGRPLRDTLVQALYPSLVDLAHPSAGARIRRALKTFTSFSVRVDSAGTWSFGLDLADATGGAAGTGNLEIDLAQLGRDVGRAAAEEGVGLALLVDEAHELARDELQGLCALVHQAGQQGWPFVVALAGLPSLPRVLAEAKSYSERLFSYHDVGALDRDAAGRALTEPAAMEGVTWESDAVAFVVDDTRGYPYFLQEYGQKVWNEASGPRITLTDARVGAATGRAHLDSGFFRGRWERATPAQRSYLAAMAEGGSGSMLSRDVARRLGRTPTSLGPARDSLIKKGLVYAPEHGHVAFTVPNMAEFVLRQVRP